MTNGMVHRPDLEAVSASPGETLGRRRFLGVAAAVPWLAACSTPLPLTAPEPAPGRDSAEALLRQSAEAHGLAAYRTLNDVNVRYEGEWRPLIDRVQPVLVDKGHRGGSEERVLPAAGLVAQEHVGPAGSKHVVWRRAPGEAVTRGDVAAWLDGRPSADAEVLDAAALVAEAYGLFLLGPLWLTGRPHTSAHGGRENVDGSPCDVVDVWMRPGLGRSPLDRLALCIDPAGRMRRVRITLEGFAGTRGAVAQVDTFDHEQRFGIVWPMRSHEDVLHPIRLPAHDWQIAGLDVNRGYGVADVTGQRFLGAAAPAAKPR